MNTDSIYEIVVSPSDGATGKNIATVMERLESHLPAWAIASDIECNDNRTWIEKMPLIVSRDEVHRYALSVGQFDWATFFFFYSQPADATMTLAFEELFLAAPITVRAVDGTWIYVYSPFQSDSAQLAEKFSVKCQQRGKGSVVHPS